MSEDFEIVVIGGGITGTGIARDCAIRGLKTALVERDDFASGTTGACSGMIHGGLRYLRYDVATTKACCQECSYTLKMAPHLLFRIPFLLPVLEDDPQGMELVETYFEAYDRFASMRKSKKHLRLTRQEAIQIEPGLTKNLKGAISFEEWGIDPFRLCILNALTAEAEGAQLFKGLEVVGFIKDGSSRVKGVVVKDRRTQNQLELRASLVLNACGPWAQKVAEMAGVEVKLRPTKGVHIVFDRRLSNVGLVARAIDGRHIFLIPYQNSTLLGSTDEDYYDELDALEVKQEEIDYLMEAAQRLFPSIKKARTLRAFAGLRPTLYEWGVQEDDLSREHTLLDHGQRDGVEGLLTVVGGKLATFRLMAQQATDMACKLLGKNASCITHRRPLLGGEALVDVEKQANQFKMPISLVQKLVSRHGLRAIKILQEAQTKPETKTLVCQCEQVMEAEILFLIREEGAKTLEELRRRSRLGMGPCQGMRCAPVAASLLARNLSLSQSQVMEDLKGFLQRRWKGKRPVLKGEQWAQEELSQSLLVAGGLCPPNPPLGEPCFPQTP